MKNVGSRFFIQLTRRTAALVLFCLNRVAIITVPAYFFDELSLWLGKARKKIFVSFEFFICKSRFAFQSEKRKASNVFQVSIVDRIVMLYI